MPTYEAGKPESAKANSNNNKFDDKSQFTLYFKPGFIYLHYSNISLQTEIIKRDKMNKFFKTVHHQLHHRHAGGVI